MEPTSLILIGLVLLVGGGTMFRTSRRVNASATRDVPAEAAQELQQARESVVSQIRQLEVQLHEHARDLDAQLATRAVILEQLLREADDRIATLEAELRDDVRRAA